MRIIYEENGKITCCEFIDIWSDKNILTVTILYGSIGHKLCTGTIKFLMDEDVNTKKIVKKAAEKGFIDITDYGTLIEDND